MRKNVYTMVSLLIFVPAGNGEAFNGEKGIWCGLGMLIVRLTLSVPISFF